MSARIITRKPRSNKNYINGPTMYENLVIYNECIKEGKAVPVKVSNYIGSCFMRIATNLTKHSRFYAYTEDYKQEMVSDAIEKCSEKILNFNIEHETRNPFAYFTSVSWNAFLNRADKETTQHYIKHKNFDVLHQIDLINEDMLSGEMNTTFNMDYHYSVIGEYETKLEEKIKSKKAKVKKDE